MPMRSQWFVPHAARAVTSARTLAIHRDRGLSLSLVFFNSTTFNNDARTTMRNRDSQNDRIQRKPDRSQAAPIAGRCT